MRGWKPSRCRTPPSPDHDWNERITAECYATNATSRITDEDGRIRDIVNNYARISFNFGPTLLSWLERNSANVYQAILSADSESRERFSGHGSAMAQGYNHMIMPLANKRDKHTEVLWGVDDFEHRFESRRRDVVARDRRGHGDPGCAGRGWHDVYDPGASPGPADETDQTAASGWMSVERRSTHLDRLSSVVSVRERPSPLLLRRRRSPRGWRSRVCCTTVSASPTDCSMLLPRTAGSGRCWCTSPPTGKAMVTTTAGAYRPWRSRSQPSRPRIAWPASPLRRIPGTDPAQPGGGNRRRTPPGVAPTAWSAGETNCGCNSGRRVGRNQQPGANPYGRRSTGCETILGHGLRVEACEHLGTTLGGRR